MLIDTFTSNGVSHATPVLGLILTGPLANKLRARYTLIVGDNEIVSKSYALKNMSSGEQVVLNYQELMQRLHPAGTGI